MAAIAEAAASWAENGYAVVRQWIAASAIDMLAREVEPVFAQWMAENRAAYERERLVNMHSLTSPRYFSEGRARARFFDLLASDSMTALVDGMFGAGIYFHNTQLFFNPHENRRLPYWHRDMQYSPVDDAEQAREQHQMLSLHVRIPLLKEQGVELIPGTHRRWDTPLECDVRWERNGHRNSEDLPGAVLVALEPGDVLVFDAQMIHRGNYALNRERKALDLCVGRAHPFTARWLDPAVLPSDDELVRVRNKAWYQRARQVAGA